MDKIDNIANFLNNNSKKCLAINGAWGIGKTYLWKQVEKKLSKVNKDKKVVYIDLFGKESYKQIFEEIVAILHGNYNKITQTTLKSLEDLVKCISGGLISLNSDTIFSFLKKKDFENIIVCFDNIERRSDSLSLKEILGLVNLLKEDKECNVVIIFHKEELNRMINKDTEENNKQSWYEIYKEKIIDYEFVINDNSKVANSIISNKIECDEKVQNIIFECYQRFCSNNLRLLLKFIEYVNYFNKECFNQYHSDKFFYIVLNIYYRDLLKYTKQHYYIPINDHDKNIDIPIFQEYFNNYYVLSHEKMSILKNNFENSLKNYDRMYFLDYHNKYLYGNLNDIDFAKYIEDLFPKFKNYIYENGTYYSITYYQGFFKLYKKITSKELDCKKNIEKNFIKELVEYEFNISILHDPFHENFYKEIKDMIEKNEEYKNYYQELQSEKRKNINIDSFFNSLTSNKIIQTFNYNVIWQYNCFEIESIVKSFQINNDFCHQFFIFFSSTMDVQMLQKYELKNNLFQAYSDFLDLKENKIKKEEILKIIKEQNHDCILLKLITS
ncbi:P-loop NTPase fold protein [Campylobacter vulpis]|uniref:P-loop NTPase fold protein n=1 Tax=Campylobacter vulpis TaxID=1655500 RepID=UPI001BCAEDA7|nr:P-loop NTPase fold protein [Campylobacter vulpis]MBS4314452.1 AAA family ATPase [Campylobacter vulpis]MBS4406054.1 AAA family ATPase [Campylobacter vulpis]